MLIKLFISSIALLGGFLIVIITSSGANLSISSGEKQKYVPKMFPCFSIFLSIIPTTFCSVIENLSKKSEKNFAKNYAAAGASQAAVVGATIIGDPLGGYFAAKKLEII